MRLSLTHLGNIWDANKKEIEFLKKRIRVEQRKNQGLEHKLKVLEHKLEVDKALMERQAYQAQLDASNISYKKGPEDIRGLMTWCLGTKNVHLSTSYHLVFTHNRIYFLGFIWFLFDFVENNGLMK